jgi:hypothetical protein
MIKDESDEDGLKEKFPQKFGMSRIQRENARNVSSRIRAGIRECPEGGTDSHVDVRYSMYLVRSRH